MYSDKLPVVQTLVHGSNKIFFCFAIIIHNKWGRQSPTNWTALLSHCCISETKHSMFIFYQNLFCFFLVNFVLALCVLYGKCSSSSCFFVRREK